MNATILPLFTEAEARSANEEWGCNCGPSALAAVCGVRLEAAGLVLPNFDRKRYTNPSMMLAGLRLLVAEGSISAFHHDVPALRRQVIDRPVFGLARVQWEGRWMRAGVPVAARYRQTHWIGVQKHPAKDEFAVFDVNAMRAGGVITAESWASTLVPEILRECVPGSDGGWHLTHVIEVTR
jgi:hypothetical protein